MASSPVGTYFDDVESGLLHAAEAEVEPLQPAGGSARMDNADDVGIAGDVMAGGADQTADEVAPPAWDAHADLAAEPITRYPNQPQQSQQHLQRPQPFAQQQAPWSRPQAAAASSSSSSWIPGSSNFSMRQSSTPAASNRGGRGGSRGGGRGGSSAGSGSSYVPFESSYFSQQRGARGGRGRGGGRGGGRGRGGRGGRNNSGDNSVSAWGDEPSVAAFSQVYRTQDQIDADAMQEDLVNPDLDFGGPDEDLYEQEQQNWQNQQMVPGGPGRGLTPSRPSLGPSSECLPISEVPAPFRSLFKYGAFNRVQSKVFHPAFYGDNNLIISAPTGSGKTVILEFAMLRFFKDDLLPKDEKSAAKLAKQRERLQAQQEEFEEKELQAEVGMIDQAEVQQMRPPAAVLPQNEGIALLPKLRYGECRKKVLYISPTKALCEERFRDWSSKFGVDLHLTTQMVTGDREANMFQMLNASIILTTPEKWDALSRRALPQDRKILASIGLVLVDEIHFLNEPKRGATLEGLLSRMQMRKLEHARDIPDPSRRLPIGNLRILALSATAPNASDVAHWLGGVDHSFSANFRPVPLDYKVYSYTKPGNNGFAFEHSLNHRLFELIQRHSEGHPVLVFNSTRKNAEQAAKAIANAVVTDGKTRDYVSPDKVPFINEARQRLPTSMADMLDAGVAFHHAGLALTERAEIERLFVGGCIRVLCSTTTLGVGVNLPCRCLLAGTPVAYADGSNRPIDSVQAGDSLLGADGPRTVLQAWSGVSPKMYTVTDADGRAYTVTPHHQVTLMWRCEPSVEITARRRTRRSLQIRWIDSDLNVHEKQVQLTGRGTTSDAELIKYGHSRVPSDALRPNQLIDVEAHKLARFMKEEANSEEAASLSQVIVPLTNASSSVSASKHSEAHLARITRVQRVAGGRFYGVEVDGDRRHVLGNGVLTHNSVIVKGTTMWDSNRKAFVEMDDTTITQMIGRAGRPQFDYKAVAIIMTAADTKDKYQFLNSGRKIESHLRGELTDQINAEIVLGGISSHALCVQWLKSTFMYQRMKAESSLYFGCVKNEQQVDDAVDQLAYECLDQLLQSGMIIESEERPGTFYATEVAQLASRWYLSFQTAQMLSAIPPTTNFEDFLEMFARSGEFDDSELRLKPGDKSLLNPFLVRHRERRRAMQPMQMIAGSIGTNVAPHHMAPQQQQSATVLKPAQIPYSVPKRKIHSREDKLKVLTQVVCMGLLEAACEKAGAAPAADDQAPGGGVVPVARKVQSIRHDAELLFDNGARIAQAFSDIMIAKAEKQRSVQAASSSEIAPETEQVGWVALKNAITFRKAIVNRAFPNSAAMYMQMRGVKAKHGPKLFAGMSSLPLRGGGPKHSFRVLAGLPEEAVRSMGFGPGETKNIQTTAKAMPDYSASVMQLGYFASTGMSKCVMRFQCNNKEALPKNHRVHLIAGSLANELVWYRCVKVSELPKDEEIILPMDTQMRVYMIDEQYVGCDAEACTVLRYGEDIVSRTMSSEEEAGLLQELELHFSELELRKVDASAAEPVLEEDLADFEEDRNFVAPDPDAAWPDEQQIRAEAESAKLTRKTHCKHSAGKCVKGECKHACCKVRAADLATGRTGEDGKGGGVGSFQQSWFANAPAVPDDFLDDQQFVGPYDEQAPEAAAAAYSQYPQESMGMEGTSEDLWNAPTPFQSMYGGAPGAPAAASRIPRKRQASSWFGEAQAEGEAGGGMQQQQQQQQRRPQPTPSYGGYASSQYSAASSNQQFEYDPYNSSTPMHPPQATPQHAYFSSTPLASNRRVQLPATTMPQQQQQSYFKQDEPTQSMYWSDEPAAAAAAATPSSAVPITPPVSMQANVSMEDDLSAYALSRPTPRWAVQPFATPASSSHVQPPSSGLIGGGGVGVGGVSRWDALKEEPTPLEKQLALFRANKEKRAKAMRAAMGPYARYK